MHYGENHFESNKDSKKSSSSTDILRKQLQKLETIEYSLDAVSLRYFTREVLTTLEEDITETIILLRQAPISTNADSIKMLMQDLRAARVELSIALSTHEKAPNKPTIFYKRLRNCQMHLQKVISHWRDLFEES